MNGRKSLVAGKDTKKTKSLLQFTRGTFKTLRVTKTGASAQWTINTNPD